MAKVLISKNDKFLVKDISKDMCVRATMNGFKDLDHSLISDSLMGIVAAQYGPAILIQHRQ